MFVTLSLASVILLIAVLIYYSEIRKHKGINDIPGPPCLPFVGTAFAMEGSTPIEIRKHKGINDIPGPPCLPFVGTAFCVEGPTPVDIFRTFVNLHKKYGPVYKVWTLWCTPAVFVADAELIEYFLTSTKHITKAYDYVLFEPWLGKGLLTSTGIRWHKHRKILTPAFHFGILEKFIEVFHSASNILIKQLSKEVGQESVNIYRFINLCALDVICESAMGTKINAQEEEESEYIKAVKRFLQLHLQRVFSFWKIFNVFFKYSSDYIEREKLVKKLHNFTNSIVSNRRQELKRTTVVKSDEESWCKDKPAFLDLLLQAKIDDEPLTNEAIREEVDTFMFEGHDTVTSAVSFALYEIARHPEVQERIVNELKAVFKQTQKIPTYKDLSELSYLNMVIKEALRLYPPVSLYERELEEDVKFDSYSFSKGTSIILHAYAIQRMPENFSNPEKFIPERFSEENQEHHHTFSYIPFSAGPRNCIDGEYNFLVKITYKALCRYWLRDSPTIPDLKNCKTPQFATPTLKNNFRQKFAILEMKCMISKILRNFKLFPVPHPYELQLYSDSILKSETGVCLRLEHR